MPTTNAPYRLLPGYLIRRVNQLLVAQFYEETSEHQITPVQWVALCATQTNPGMDQITLSRDIAIDTSTLAGVIDRLELRGLVQRKPSPNDKRVKLLFVTKKGASLLTKTSPKVIALQDWLLSALAPKERKTFLKHLHQLILGHVPSAAEILVKSKPVARKNTSSKSSVT
jgi:DNA-binding MarR family transcriptional regulator